MNCSHCGKVLKAFGDKRENGKFGRKDFEGRKTHLKCWKEIQQRKELDEWAKRNMPHRNL